jgi:hypothetical protein
MAMLRKLAVLATAAAAARKYAQKNPEKVSRIADQAGVFLDRRTGGKYHHQIDGAVRKAKNATRRSY